MVRDGFYFRGEKKGGGVYKRLIRDRRFSMKPCWRGLVVREIRMRVEDYLRLYLPTVLLSTLGLEKQFSRGSEGPFEFCGKSALVFNTSNGMKTSTKMREIVLPAPGRSCRPCSRRRRVTAEARSTLGGQPAPRHPWPFRTSNSAAAACRNLPYHGYRRSGSNTAMRAYDQSVWFGSASPI